MGNATLRAEEGSEIDGAEEPVLMSTTDVSGDTADIDDSDSDGLPVAEAAADPPQKLLSNAMSGLNLFNQLEGLGLLAVPRTRLASRVSMTYTVWPSRACSKPRTDTSIGMVRVRATVEFDCMKRDSSMRVTTTRTRTRARAWADHVVPPASLP